MNNADYRKINDRSLNSSTYHKKDGTAVRAKLVVDTREQIADATDDKTESTTIKSVD